MRDAVAALLADHPPARTDPTTFLGAQYDAGLAWVHFDRAWGGLGVPPALQADANAALRQGGAPSAGANYVGVHQGAAVIHEFGDDKLKQRLRPAFTNEEWWCQLFSEPGAGSDLAGLATSAVRDGDEWIVNGQKVWTSFAHKARWAILLARTDPNVPKHRGLTFFVVDMHDAGVDVRPIHQPDGGHEFNEVFLTDVRVPDAYRLGEVGHGWGVSMFMIGAEREGVTGRLEALSRLLDAWRQRRPLGTAEAAYRERVSAAYVDNEVFRLLTLRAKQTAGERDLSSLVKLGHDLVEQSTANLVMDVLGAAGSLGDYGWVEGDSPPSPSLWFVRTRSSTIGGGTSEIMRNLLGERYLGLPGDVRLDKDLSWKRVPRS